MSQATKSKGELRSAFTLREVRRAQEHIPTGVTGVLVRVTLAVLFMFLIVISFDMFGIAGPVSISLLFLVAFFVPFLYQTATAYLARRKGQTEDAMRELESGV